jgi:hypothetical protein
MSAAARWQVIAHARGWHVSRETLDAARPEFLLNEVHRVRIFRSLGSAIQACALANFEADASRLATEPLLNPCASVAA